MLTREALDSAVPLTELLDNSKFALLPVTGSPLESLVNATRSDAKLAMRMDDGSVQIQVSDIEYLANAKDPVLNVCKHDMSMDEITEVVSNAVKGHVLFAKTTVAPAVAELAARVAEVLNNTPISQLLGMNVEVYEYPKPLLNSALESMVRKFEETAFDVPKLAMSLPALSGTEIKDVMMSGSGGMDKDIEEWLSAKGETFLLNIWSNLFQIKQADLNQSIPDTFDTWTEKSIDSIDNALAIFLLSRNLSEKPLPNTEMSLPAFEKLIIDYRNQSGARLCRVLEQMDDVSKKGLLVKQVIGSTTIVYADTYRKWMETGGDNEVLFGNLLKAPYATTVDVINEKASSFKAAWNHYAALTSTVEANKKFARTKEALKDQFYKQLREAHQEADGLPTNVEVVRNLFNEQLESMNDADLSDLYAACLKLVCRSRFYKTDAEKILFGIERVKRENPNVCVREAAAISTIEYIAQWLVSQMKVVAV